MTKFLDEYFFRLKRNKQESMSAWALREEKVYLQMTRALTRLEQTAESTEPDWNLLYERHRTGADGIIGLVHGVRTKATTRMRALTEMVNLPRKHSRVQNMKSVMNTN